MRLCPPVDLARLRPVARVRVLYADTDKMGIAYHAAYLRYMELGREMPGRLGRLQLRG